MTDLDIIMITKNSVEPCLDESLNSIEEAAKFSQIKPRLIVVDGGSDDGTLDIVESHREELNTVILFDEGNRATARQLGIEHVETELFAFIDSDVVLIKEWIAQMIPYFDDTEVGAVWGAALQTAPRKKKYFEAMAKLYGKSPLEMMKNFGVIRGCLHDTMIRTEAVRDMEIPPHLHVMEDHYVRQHIEKSGLRWVSTEKPYVYHNMGEDTPDNAYMDAYYGWKLGVYNKTWYAKHVALSWAKLAYLLLATRDLRLVRDEAVKEWEYLKATGKLVVEALM